MNFCRAGTGATKGWFFMKSDKLIFRGILVYLPVSIFLVFWLYLVSIAYDINAWQYRLFYGENGSIALLWLLLALLPALLFLFLKARGMLLLSRISGGAGFYCLLGSLISNYSGLAVVGIILLVFSTFIRRWNRA